jgi:hypothetical protein
VVAAAAGTGALMAGQHIAWSDDDLDRLSAITMDDLNAARSWWRQYAPKRDRDLLDIGTTDIARGFRALTMVERATTTDKVDPMHERFATGSADVAAWQLNELQVRKMNVICGVAVRRGGWDHVRITDFE